MVLLLITSIQQQAYACGVWVSVCGVCAGVFVSLHVCVSVCMLRLHVPYLNVRDRASQIAAIESSFEQAKQLVKQKLVK